MSLWETMVAIFWFMLLVAWFWLLISILADLFRDRDLSGWDKGLWCLLLIVVPWGGVVVYLFVRGSSMHERAMAHAERNEADSRRDVEDDSQPSGVADELTKLADLRDRGAITSDEFGTAKSMLLGQTPSGSMSRNRDVADTTK